MQIKDDALQQAILLRKSGMSNRKIAEYTGIPYEKVRYQCKKQDCDSVLVDEELPAKIKSREACAYCGKPVTQNEHSAGRKKCRRKYWKIHRPDQKRNPKAIYTKVCAYCGKTFEVYGNKNRKYCCHEHYVADYFGDGKYSRVS